MPSTRRFDDGERAAKPLVLRVGPPVAIGIGIVVTILFGPIVGLLTLPVLTVIFVVMAFRTGGRGAG
jgi:hypothetical protein